MPRNPHDFYPTPTWCVEALARAFPALPAPTLDPCAGDGALLRASELVWGTRPRGVEIVPEIAARGEGIGVGDGLQAIQPEDVLIVNPPFRSSLEWAEACMKARACYMLVRLGFLASQGRRDFFQRNPPRAICVLSRRPSFTGAGTDKYDYCWLVWGDVPIGDPIAWEG